MDDNSEVIDLTQSIIYCRAPINLSCSIIDLDDSSSLGNEASSPPIETTAEPIVIDNETEILPAVNNTRKSQTKKSTSTKNKRRSRTSVTATTSVRERSPHYGDCPICRDPLGACPMASTKCGHVYCIRCIEQSVKIEKKCPTCRKQLKGSTAYHPLFL